MHRLTSSLPAYACHVTRTWSRDTHSTWRNGEVLEDTHSTWRNGEVLEEKTSIYYSTPTF